MNNFFSKTLILLTGLVVALPLHTAHANDDHIEARRLHESGEILPLESILKIIRLTYPGMVLEIELDKEAGNIVYEVEILGEDGVVRKIYINAKTGQLLYEKKDD